jgi:hypothetical protein
MAAVSETIVREYFELHEFLVRQHRKYIAQNRKQDEDDDIDFFVLNPKSARKSGELPFILASSDVSQIDRAIVVVKGWHTETFSTARIEQVPQIFRFVEPKVFEHASRAFGQDGKPLKILVVPGLPQDEKSRDESISLLRAKGIDAVIPFRTILNDLVREIEINRNYQKSDILQVIRILKNYDFFKEPQLELFKAARRRIKKPRAKKTEGEAGEAS